MAWWHFALAFAAASPAGVWLALALIQPDEPMPEIVKVQLRLPDTPRTDAVVYAQGRKRVFVVTLTPAQHAATRGEASTHWLAYWRGNHWQLSHPTSPQDW